MKKIIALLLVILCYGCEKEQPNIKVLNISEYISLIGMSTEDAQKAINAEWLYGSSYTLQTENAKYSITLKSNNNIINEINIYSSLDCTKENGLLLYRSEMDKVNGLRNYCTYVSRYSSSSAGLIDFSDRREFWEYVEQRGVDISLTELWWLCKKDKCNKHRYR